MAFGQSQFDAVEKAYLFGELKLTQVQGQVRKLFPFVFGVFLVLLSNVMSYSKLSKRNCKLKFMVRVLRSKPELEVRCHTVVIFKACLGCPLLSKNCATRVLSFSGIWGKIDSAAAKSFLRTAVWYSITERSNEYETMLWDLSIKKTLLYRGI